MILQISFTLIYRIVLETSGASNFRIVELHWRDFAVYVSLSSRTNTRQGFFADEHAPGAALVLTIRREAGCARASSRSFFWKSVRGL
jgi:hypothetical protein